MIPGRILHTLVDLCVRSMREPLASSVPQVNHNRYHALNMLFMKRAVRLAFGVAMSQSPEQRSLMFKAIERSQIDELFLSFMHGAAPAPYVTETLMTAFLHSLPESLCLLKLIYPLPTLPPSLTSYNHIRSAHPTPIRTPQPTIEAPHCPSHLPSHLPFHLHCPSHLPSHLPFHLPSLQPSHLPSAHHVGSRVRVLDLSGSELLVSLPSWLPELPQLHVVLVCGCSKLKQLPANLSGIHSKYKDITIDFSGCSALFHLDESRDAPSAGATVFRDAAQLDIVRELLRCAETEQAVELLTVRDGRGRRFETSFGLKVRR